MNAFARRLLCGAALLALLASVAPSPAHATSDTIKRSVQNILFFPLYVALKALWVNWNDSDDTTAVKIVYPLPGAVWLVSVNLGASAIRGLAGVLEFVPGLILIPFEADLDAIYDLPEDREAVVDWESDFINVRFGIDYVSPGY